MTTLTATLEDFWDDLDVMPQSPFSTLETFPDSDPSSECETEEVSSSLFSTQALQQEHIASALQSALHQALAKYSVARNKRPSTTNTQSTEISEFWNGWFNDIEIDDEINLIEDTTTTAAAASTEQEDEITNRTEQHPTNQEHPNPTTTTPPLPSLPSSPSLLIASSLGSSSSSSLEVIPLEKQRKKRRSSKRSVCGSGKGKKRKSDHSEEKNPLQNHHHTHHHHRKKFTSSALKEVFKLEQVLKIKTADQDSENEEVDIGDSTTWNG